MRPTIFSIILSVCLFLFGYAVGRAQNTKTKMAQPPITRPRIIPVARVVGDNGYLIGWDVVDQNSEKLCSDPYIWVATREIECEIEE